MNIHELRRQTYMTYECLCLDTGSYCGAPYAWEVSGEVYQRHPFTNTAFKDAIRQQFGDLRRKETWRQAAIHYAARSTAKGSLEPYQLVCYIALPEHLSDPVRDAYGPEVIEAILSYPEIAAKVRAGLEQLVREQPEVAREFVRTYKRAIAPAAVLPVTA